MARYAVFSMIALPLYQLASRLSEFAGYRCCLYKNSRCPRGTLCRAVVQDICYEIHVCNKSRLRAMNGGQLHACLERSGFAVAHGAGADYEAQTFFCNFQGSFTGEYPAQSSQRACVKAPVGLLGQFAVCQTSSTPGQAACTLRISDQLAQSQKNVLIASEAPDTRFLHHLTQSVRSQCRHVCAYRRALRV